MSQADISTTLIRSRRAVLAGIASAAAVPIVAAIPTAASPSIAIEASPEAAALSLPHPDAKLLELGLEYERLLAIEGPLKAESGRLWNLADRLRYEKLGIDPEDEEARRAVFDDSYSKWNEARDVADEEVGYHKAWRKFNGASPDAGGGHHANGTS